MENLIHRITIEEQPQVPYPVLHLATAPGTVTGHLYSAPSARGGAIWVGGIGGGWDTPAQGLYPRLCEALRAEGIIPTPGAFLQNVQLTQ